MQGNRNPGIEVRHARSCCSRDRGRCTCTPSYQANVYDARNDRRIRRTFPTKTEAKLWRQDALVALRHGTLPTPTRTTVSQALTGLLEAMRDGVVMTRSGERYRPATVRSYAQAVRSFIEPALGSMRLHEVRRRDVQAFVDQLRADGLGASTIANKIDPLRVLFRRAVRDDLVAIDPTDGLELPAVRGRRDRIATVASAEALIDAAPEQDRAMWACALYAGLRRGELRALRWRHVDFDAGVVRVEDGWDDQEGEQDAKTAAGRRTVPMAGALRRELASHKLRTGRGDDDLVFGRTASLPFVPSTVRRRARSAWAAVGLEPLTPHEARHCCASYLIAAGLNAKQVQTYIGHSDIRTTFNIYGHLLPGDEDQAAAALDAYLDAAASR